MTVNIFIIYYFFPNLFLDSELEHIVGSGKNFNLNHNFYLLQ